MNLLKYQSKAVLMIVLSKIALFQTLLRMQCLRLFSFSGPIYLIALKSISSNELGHHVFQDFLKKVPFSKMLFKVQGFLFSRFSRCT